MNAIEANEKTRQAFDRILGEINLVIDNACDGGHFCITVPVTKSSMAPIIEKLREEGYRVQKWEDTSIIVDWSNPSVQPPAPRNLERENVNLLSMCENLSDENNSLLKRVQELQKKLDERCHETCQV